MGSAVVLAAVARVAFDLAVAVFVVVVAAFDFAEEAAVPEVAELVVAFAALALVTLLGGDTSGSMLTLIGCRNEVVFVWL